MSRPRTPTAILDARGSFLRHPERKRKNAPEPTGTDLGPPPKWLPKKVACVWSEVASRIPPGVAGRECRDSFEQLCRLIARQREGEVLRASTAQLLRGLCSDFGFTPVSRGRLVVPQPEKENPLERFLRKSDERTTAGVRQPPVSEPN